MDESNLNEGKQQLLTNTQQDVVYKIIKLIGEGSFGSIYEAQVMESKNPQIPKGIIVAIKVFNIVRFRRQRRCRYVSKYELVHKTNYFINKFIK